MLSRSISSMACDDSLLLMKTNQPLDARTIVGTVNEIENISYPFVGMLIYVLEDKNFYVVRSLKSAFLFGVEYPDSQVDKYEVLAANVDFATNEEVNAMLAELGLK